MNREVIHDFSALGQQISTYLLGKNDCSLLNEAVQQSVENNSWFTVENIRQSLAAIATEFLDEQKLHRWLSNYSATTETKRVGVVMAGNIPLVGFHDFLCVLAAGHFFVGKLSHKDAFLLPAITGMLYTINPEWRYRIEFVKDISDIEIDALIATGSNNTAGYFEKKYKTTPAIVRHNRRSVAILQGNETPDELAGLANDMLAYFGLGCRNVSLLYVPESYSWSDLKKTLSMQKELLQHTGYAHNFCYQKAVLTLQNQSFIDAETVLLCENNNLQAPPAVVHFQYYRKMEAVLQFIEQQKEHLQCVVGNKNMSDNFSTFGEAQRPHLWDYADGADTMKFLCYDI